MRNFKFSNRPRRTPRLRRTQRGSALLITLIFMLMLAIVAAGAMQSSTLQERMAGNTRDYNVAFQGAEVGLREGETLVSAVGILPIYNGTPAGRIAPLAYPANPGSSAYWQSYDWTNSSAAASTNINTDGSQNKPQYVIEQFLKAPCSEAIRAEFTVGIGGKRRAPNGDDCQVYRITSRAQGPTGNSVVILQSTFKRRLNES